MRLRTFFAALAVLAVLLFGCQQHIPTQVVVTPHPQHPTHMNAAFFADSVDVGLTKPPYDYHGSDFTLTSATATITVTCYGADQTNFQSAPYTIAVDAYYSGQPLQHNVAVATCKQGNPATTTGAFSAPVSRGRHFYLLIHAGGPWTVEVDPA